MNSHYSNLKSIFVDGETFDYVNLDQSVLTYDKLVQTLDKPLKLILFYGKPGTGKTFLLQKIYNDLKHKKKIVFFRIGSHSVLLCKTAGLSLYRPFSFNPFIQSQTGIEI